MKLKDIYATDFYNESFNNKLKIAGYIPTYWYVGIDKLTYKQKYFKKLIEFEDKINHLNIDEVLPISFSKFTKFLGIDEIKASTFKKQVVKEIIHKIRKINKDSCIHDYEFSKIKKQKGYLNRYHLIAEANLNFYKNLKDFKECEYISKKIITRINNFLFLSVEIAKPLYSLLMGLKLI